MRSLYLGLSQRSLARYDLCNIVTDPRLCHVHTDCTCVARLYSPE